MIKLQNVNKHFTVDGKEIIAMSDINLNVERAEIFGVIGPSGAGKSTLIRSINLLEQPSSGEVIVDGQNLTKLSGKELQSARKNIGMIFQHFNLMSSRTVYENIILPLRLTGKKPHEIEKIVSSLLDLTGLNDKKHTYPSQLSGGQKQRVAIARALTMEPKVLLSDEVTSALDPQTSHSILTLLKKINREMGVTILMITHEMSVAKEICHRLAIMEHGKIIEQSEVLEFFANPKSDLAKQFIRKDLKNHLPESIALRLHKQIRENSAPVIRLSFLGRTAEEPLIAHLMQNLSISINILLADIEIIRDQMVGTMIIEATADEAMLLKALQYLRDKKVNAEVIGYVERTH